MFNAHFFYSISESVPLTLWCLNGVSSSVLADISFLFFLGVQPHFFRLSGQIKILPVRHGPSHRNARLLSALPILLPQSIWLACRLPPLPDRRWYSRPYSPYILYPRSIEILYYFLIFSSQNPSGRSICFRVSLLVFSFSRFYLVPILSLQFFFSRLPHTPGRNQCGLLLLSWYFFVLLLFPLFSPNDIIIYYSHSILSDSIYEAPNVPAMWKLLLFLRATGYRCQLFSFFITSGSNLIVRVSLFELGKIGFYFPLISGGSRRSSCQWFYWIWKDGFSANFWAQVVCNVNDATTELVWRDDISSVLKFCNL